MKEFFDGDNVKGGKRLVNVGSVPKDAITYFGDGYHFLSNFYPCKVTYKEVTYPTTEHAFQAMKTKNKNLRKIIASLEKPNDAKHAGRTLRLREDWEEIKFDIMRDLLVLKFTQPEFREALLETGERQLIEGNWWYDQIWGVFRGKGENHLGNMLMQLRKQLKEDK